MAPTSPKTNHPNSIDPPGLDAFQALSVMSAMKELAGAGRTVVAVIHQPRSSIYTMLDHLVLLSEGRTVYVGPAQEAHAWFARQGFVCPAGAAPADYFLDVMAKVKVGGRWELECPELH